MHVCICLLIFKIKSNTGLKSTIGAEGRNIQPEQNEETRIQKIEERLRNLQDYFKGSNIQITGVPEGEQEEQEIENVLEKIMEENFPNLAKDTDFQESPGSSESQS